MRRIIGRCPKCRALNTLRFEGDEVRGVRCRLGACRARWRNYMRLLSKYGLKEVRVDLSAHLLLVTTPGKRMIPHHRFLQKVLEQTAAIRFGLKLTRNGVAGYRGFRKADLKRVSGLFGWISAVPHGCLTADPPVLKYWARILILLLCGDEYQESIIAQPRLSNVRLLALIGLAIDDVAQPDTLADRGLAVLIQDLFSGEPVFKAEA